MLMNFLISLIWWIVALGIMTPLKKKNVKLVAIKMRKNASILWENFTSNSRLSSFD